MRNETSRTNRTLCAAAGLVLSVAASGQAQTTPGQAQPAQGQVQRITCESTGDKYKYCSAKTDNQVRMLQQISDARCDQGKSWGYDKNGVWVDHNCVAEFEVGRSGPGTSEKIAAGAAAGLAVLQAFLAAGQPSSTAPAAAPPPAPVATAGSIPSWLVGTFQATHPKTGAQVYVTVDPQGLVEGRANDQQFFGRVKGDQIFIGSSVFAFQQKDTGVFIYPRGKEADGVSFTPVR